MGTKEHNSQSSLSPAALQYLQAGQVPTEAAGTGSSQSRKRSKVVMLGSSGAGKTTLLKSMAICCEDPYSRVEREMFKEAIYKNLIEDIRTIFDVMKTFDIEPAFHDSHDNFQTVIKATSLGYNELPVDVVLAVKALWDDSSVQAGFQGSNHYLLNDTRGHFFENLDRITSSNYMPTNQDILRFRFRTIGVTQKDLAFGDLDYNIWDVGGTRKERRKWIHCITSVDVIIFSVDISAYDQSVYEDEKSNVMQEDLHLFNSLCKSIFLRRAILLLFFNKVDLLQRKLATRSFNDYFADFDGDRLNLEDVKTYIANKFMRLNDHKPKNMTHVCFTNMTEDDKSLGKAAFTALQTCVKIKESYDNENKQTYDTQAMESSQPSRFKQWFASKFSTVAKK